MRITVIGSCLSAHIARALCKRHGASALPALHHVRSDILRRYFVDARYQPPTEAQLLEAIRRYGTASKKKKNQVRAAAQTREAFEAVGESLRRADVLVMDNHYELTYAAKALVDGDARHEVSLYYAEEKSTELEPLPSPSPEEARRNISAFVEAARKRNPGLEVYYVLYPYEHLDRTVEGGRYKRARAFAASAEPLVGVDLLPAFALPRRFQDDMGSLYFEPHVYEVYAQHIHDTWHARHAGAPTPSTLTLERFLRAAPASRAPASKSPGHSTSPSGSPGDAGDPGSPYAALPPRSFWRTGVAERSFLELSDLYRRRFEISPADRIGTFGSCFAQHVGASLRHHGFDVLDAEPPPGDMDADTRRAHGYGLYSARYGNVYTARQLLQLFLRAFGRFQPAAIALGDGPYYDAFRPNLQPGGYASLDALRADVAAHLERVKRVFLELDVMVMTLGLTEAWVDAADGAVFPVCPGTTHGRFDPSRHLFHNFTYPEVVADLERFMDELRQVNPKARLVLTVSPVPLTATAEADHVLTATTYSKAVLRAVCGDLVRRHAHVDYFPSYEIIASHPGRAMFFDPNLRTVSRRGVAFVMEHFFKEHGGARDAASAAEELDDAHCDEAFLALAQAGARPEA